MKKGNFIGIIILQLLFARTVMAQDFHLSQFHRAPLILNPAMTGFMLGKYRLGVNYRNQWGSVKSKYETYETYFNLM
jgi:hypothetical protein